MTDNELLLAILRDWQGQWVHHGAILRQSELRAGHGMTVHSRISDLRKRGHVIDCKVEVLDKRRVSYYRLVSEAGGADLSQPVVGRAEPATLFNTPRGAYDRD